MGYSTPAKERPFKIETPRASLISARGNAPGTGRRFELQAKGLPHMRFCALLSTRAPMNRAVGAHSGFLLHFSWGVAPGWYELPPLASPEKYPNSAPR
jgi:hypothetical protein